MTARQHLVMLEKDGLVRSEKVRRHTGRPHYLYSLTPKGEDLFPSRYDLLAQILLDEASLLESDEIEGLGADEKRSLLLRRTTDRLAERFRVQAEGRSLEERVAAVTEVLHLIGGFAEWRALEDGYEIRDYNCVFGRLGPQEVSGCQWHVNLLTQLLGWPVTHELESNGRADSCRYLICKTLPRAQTEGLLTNA